jgi:low temperature requirement protein LtrA
LFSQSESKRGVARLAPFNLASAGLVLAAGFLDGEMVYALWALGLGLQVITPYLGVAPQFVLNVEHFVERHGLLIIVALGESVIAIGLSVDTDHLTPGLVAAVLLGLGLPAALWWSYFAVDHVSAEDALGSVAANRRALVAIHAYFYAHIPMLLGIVVTAAGIHEAIAHPGETLRLPAALALSGGVTLFFVGDTAFRHTLAIGSVTPRLVLAVAALATVPLGVEFPAWGQLAALVVLIVLTLLVESQTTSHADSR